jgi:hypothetical protein
MVGRSDRHAAGRLLNPDHGARPSSEDGGLSPAGIVGRAFMTSSSRRWSTSDAGWSENASVDSKPIPDPGKFWTPMCQGIEVGHCEPEVLPVARIGPGAAPGSRFLAAAAGRPYTASGPTLAGRAPGRSVPSPSRVSPGRLLVCSY